MDFMKVVDQAVREIKREVNLKVLKVPEIEQKVLDATDDEPWGPHGTVLAEIAQATKKYTECQMVMNVLWTRLTETGKNWRFVYKALAVIEYLVSHGSEKAVDDIIEHTFQISALSSFEYVEPNGKDVGINVRKKAETIVALLNNKDKIQEVREKAAANREKYFGLSSTGITYKSGAPSFGTGSFQSGERYGGFGSTRDGDRFRDSYKGYDSYGGRKTDEDTFGKSRKGDLNDNQENKGKGSSTYGSREKHDTSTTSKAASIPSQSSNKFDVDDDFDDFDPRGTSSSKATSGNANQVDLFGDSLIGDLLDAPAPVPSKTASVNSEPSNVDLFADADFVSAAPKAEKGADPQSQTSVDLFSSQAAMPAASSPALDLFSATNSVPQPEINAPKAEQNSQVIDPFAAIPMNSFDGSDGFGAFTSNSDSLSTESKQTTANDGNVSKLSEKALESNPSTKKGTFQVKSGIWADSLTRGIIDLNITAPKKASLAEVGIVGGLGDGSDERDKGPLASYYMGMGAGSGAAQTGFMSSPAMGGLGQMGLYSSPAMGGGFGQPGYNSSPAAMGRGLSQAGFTSAPAMGGGLGQTGFNSSPANGGDDFFSSLSSQQYTYGGFKK